MGQVANSEISRSSRQNDGGRASRKALLWFRASLVGSVIAAGIWACAQEQPKAAAPVAFNQQRAWQDLTKQLSFGVRMTGTPGQVKCKDYIVEELKKSCDSVRTQEFEHTWSKTRRTLTMWNVIGEQNWKNAKTRVLLMTHWDTRPTADQEFDGGRAAKPIMGANDGASGVAVLLELARVLKETKPDVGVMYLFTDGEDLGPSLNEMFLGAVHFSKNLPDPRPDYGILLDMIGDKDLQIPVEPNSFAFAPNLIRALYNHAEEIGLGKTFPKVRGPEISDDHLSLNEAGIPTVDFIDFDYPAWHTLSDTVDKVSADSLGKVGRFLQTWLEKKPAYVYKK